MGGSIPGLASSKRSFVSRHPPHVSFEFFPPKTSLGWEKLKETARHLAEFSPDFASVTFGAGGSGNVRTLEACLTVRSEMNADVVPHLSCIGQTREMVDAHLDAYAEAGLTRVLALRGDVPIGAPSTELAFPPGGFRYASALVEFIKKRGDFHILVGCYPEGHPEAPSLQTDIDNFVRKVEAGADAAVTQYFFNNASYFHFVEELRRRGLDTPVVVGLMPPWPYDQVAGFSQKCGADVPLWIRKRMEGYRDDPKSQYDFAVEVALTQSEELLRNGAPGIHFYTLNRPEAVVRICEHLRGQQVERRSADELSYGDIEIPASLS